MTQEETITFLMKLRVEKKPDMLGVVVVDPPRLTHSPDKGTEVQPEERRQLELGREGCRDQRKTLRLWLAAVSSGHGQLTGGSLSFPAQQCGGGAQELSIDAFRLRGLPSWESSPFLTSDHAQLC